MSNLLLPFMLCCRKSFFIFFLLTFSLSSFAQDVITINGKITSDIDGELLPGVSVRIKDSPGGTITDINGNFVIKANKDAILIFNYLGYVQQQISVAGRTNLNIKLKLNVNQLTEVVITGYGGNVTSLEKTSSSVNVKSKEFENTTVNTIDDILQGRAAGVNVVSISGEPGSETLVQIRGTASLSGSNQPLYVIDGFPVAESADAPTQGLFGTNGTNSLFGLNPNDIESMEILKDASATAIYGSRAANGVVLITTKKGNNSSSGSIEITNKSGTSIITSPYTMMNGYEFADIKNQQALQGNTVPKFNLDSIDRVANTNWLGQITRPGFRQESAFNLRGGTQGTNYFLSGSYLNEKGILYGSDVSRGNLRFNINSNINSWHTIKAQLAATNQKTRVGITVSRGWPSQGGPLLDALRASPLLRDNSNEIEFDDPAESDAVNGVTFGGGNPFQNPVANLKLKTDFRYQDQLITNLENVFTFGKKKFDLHLITGASFNNTERNIQLPPAIFVAANGSVQEGLSKVFGYNFSLFLNHKYKMNNHSLTNTIGVEKTRTATNSFNAQGADTDVSAIALANIGLSSIQNVSSGRAENTIQSAFYRFNYSYKDRYVVSGSIRADGSSRFAENQKYGYFPSVGVAWNISEESFIKDKLEFVNLFKFRSSYGAVGNDRSLPNNQSLALFSPGLYEVGIDRNVQSSTLALTQSANPNLKWETSIQFNAATDISLFKNKLSVTLEYYNKQTKDLLQNTFIPTQSGLSRAWQNLGSLSNKGIELTVNTNQINNKSFTWSTSFNISKNKTVVEDLGDFDPIANGISSLGGNLLGGGTNILIPGEELGLLYGYKVIGLYQLDDFNPNGSVKAGVPVLGDFTDPDARPGRLKYADTNQDGVINEKDRVIIGKAQPDAILGLTNNLKYKSLTLSVLFTASIGNDLYNITNSYLQSGTLNINATSFNQTREWFQKRWTIDNQHNDPSFPALQTVTNQTITDAKSNFVEDGTYVRLKTVTLSYGPKLKSNLIKSFRVYVTGTSLISFSKYRGFDPEVSLGTNPLQMGLDYGAYPRNRNITLGLSVGL